MKDLKLVILLMFTLVAIPLSGFAADNETIAKYFEQSFKYEAAGDYSAALNSVLHILQIEIKNYIATLRAGWLTYLKKDYKESVSYYKRAISLAPGAVEPKLGLLLPLIASKEWGAAEKLARDILKIDPNNYVANRKLAYVLFSQAKYGKALAQYRKVLTMYPSDIEMMLGIGWTYFQMDKNQKARSYFKQVLKVRKNNPSALYGMELLETVVD